MSLNQRATAEFSTLCTPSAPHSRDLYIQTSRTSELTGKAERLGALQNPTEQSRILRPIWQICQLRIPTKDMKVKRGQAEIVAQFRLH
jgi:hypothetical protein